MFVCFVVVGFFGGRLFGCVGWVFFFWKNLISWFYCFF